MCHLGITSRRTARHESPFYQAYLPYFYNWKKLVKDLTEEDELQEQLHHALRKLALAGIESSSRYRLPRKLAVKEMGQERFKLACDLGWLNIVNRDPKTNENIYAFFHPTFQEYYAACAVGDWDLFVPRNHIDRPVEGKKYRIFEAKWKEVILLWLGREDIDEQEKKGFIQVLVEFEDGCWDNNYEGAERGFYSYRAYCLAGAGVDEFKVCSRIEKIVGKIVGWSIYLSIIIHKSSNLTQETLLETHQPTAVRILSNLIATTEDENTRREAAYSLEKILTKPYMRRVVTALRYSLFDKTYSILWDCAQNLTYPEFYQAWHSQKIDRN